MKVESLVRRYRIYRGKPKQVEAPAMKVSKRLVLCEEKGYVIRDGEVIPLTNKEVEILRFFMDRPGRAYTECYGRFGRRGEALFGANIALCIGPHLLYRSLCPLYNPKP